MKVPELKNEAKQRGVKHSSLRKEELLARLLELYDQELANCYLRVNFNSGWYPHAETEDS